MYPAGAEVFAFEPLGKVRVKNTSAQTDRRYGRICHRSLHGWTDGVPTGTVDAGTGGRRFLFLLFSMISFRQVSSLAVHEGNVLHPCISCQMNMMTDIRPALLCMEKTTGMAAHSSLRYFVRPDDPAVLRYSRDILLQHLDSLSSVAKALEPFTKARLLLNAFAGKLLYVSDPKTECRLRAVPLGDPPDPGRRL